MSLCGGRVRLRRPTPDDINDRLSLGQTPEILRMFGADPAETPQLTLVAAEDFVRRLSEHPHAWVIEHNGHFTGEIRLDDIHGHDRRARLAIGLYDPAKLGIGIGREAIKLLLAHAFEGLHLHRVSLRVLDYNERAIRAYKACGFVEEGREREAAFVGGSWHDDVIMGILVDDWRAAQRLSSAALAGWPGQARP